MSATRSSMQLYIYNSIEVNIRAQPLLSTDRAGRIQLPITSVAVSLFPTILNAHRKTKAIVQPLATLISQPHRGR